LRAVLAWRAAKTRIYRRRVALFGAVCCWSFGTGASPWLSTRPAPALHRFGPTRSPIMTGNVVSSGTYHRLAGGFLGQVGFGPSSTLKCSANVKIETAIAVIDNAGVIRDSTPCEVWLRYHPTQRRQGNQPDPREIHIQLVNEMTRVKACAKLLLPSRNAGCERGVSCRTPSAPRNRDSS
jgi:hypothetical protein